MDFFPHRGGAPSFWISKGTYNSENFFFLINLIIHALKKFKSFCFLKNLTFRVVLVCFTSSNLSIFRRSKFLEVQIINRLFSRIKSKLNGVLKLLHSNFTTFKLTLKFNLVFFDAVFFLRFKTVHKEKNLGNYAKVKISPCIYQTIITMKLTGNFHG